MMMGYNEDGFPCPPVERKPGASEMTLRDYFAAKAMQGMLSGAGIGYMNVHPSYYDSLSGTAKTAYQIADAMLEARND